MAQPEHLNILILIPHDLGNFLGCCGQSDVRSPCLDRLAAEGVQFTHCFTTAPECTSSRSSLMTGLYPHQNGLMGLANFGWSLRVPHLAARLRDLGYATHHFGFQHETHGPVETLGYQHAHHEGGNQAGVVCDHVCQFLQSAAAQSGPPWFAYAGFFNVHRPWKKETGFDPAALRVPDWLPDHPVVRRDLARFYQDIADMDAAVGRVHDMLKNTGLNQNTLLIFTTDHGAAFPGAKATLYDPGVHVPLLLYGPDPIRGGIQYNELISNMDLVPTLLELAGGTAPDGLAGRSLLPLLQGQANCAREDVGGALFYDVAYDPMHYIRTATHKYIRSFAVADTESAGADPETLSTFAAGRWIRVDDFDVLTSPSWQALAPVDGAPRPEPEELYDLRADPCERHNLVHDPASRPVLDDMRRRLRRMMDETGSPLLQGHVPPTEQQRDAMRTHHPRSARSLETIAARRALVDSLVRI